MNTGLGIPKHRVVVRKKSTGFVGQATVEGAFLIPIILLLLLLLVQPGIVLYDRMVMQGAAAEGCRLLATRSDEIEGSNEAYEEYIRRRLASIPQQENFHMHQKGCSWVIELEGNENTDRVTVRIENEIKPLPLFDFGAEALGLTNERGAFVQQVEVSQRVRNGWVAASEDGIDPRAWIERNKAEREEG